MRQQSIKLINLRAIFWGYLANEETRPDLRSCVLTLRCGIKHLSGTPGRCLSVRHVSRIPDAKSDLQSRFTAADDVDVYRVFLIDITRRARDSIILEELTDKHRVARGDCLRIVFGHPFGADNDLRKLPDM